MTTTLTRRGLLAAGAALAAVPLLPTQARAASDARALTATTRTLDLRGRAVPVLGLVGSDGRPGLALDPGERFRVELTNDLAEPTSIHWHGQIPPNAQDGAPGLPLPALAPGESRPFDFAARPGPAPTGRTATTGSRRWRSSPHRSSCAAPRTRPRIGSRW